jgi:hypothetical protein
MGFLDKVKEQAAAAQVMAKEGAHKAQAKIDEVQSKRGADAQLRDLGAAYYAQQTGRGDGSDIPRIVAALQAHEEANGPLNLDASAPADAAPATGGGGVPTSSVPQSVPTSSVPQAVPTSSVPESVPQSAPVSEPQSAPPPLSGSTL